MTIVTTRFFILTGGPGAGKSTLIGELARRGFATSAEVGREIIREQSSVDGRGLPWVDPSLFAELMLSREMRNHRAHAGGTAPVFFDRGVPDVAGYLSLSGLPVPPHMEAAARQYRYHRRVFVLPPWEDIYARDAERRQSLEEAERTFDAMVRTYAGYGYELVEVPRLPVGQRADFVESLIGG
ncbi:AAA family ATPase [Cupriavidus basilensis]|uniref:AAA family ATPase n=1 Tax=Cupriavidus basilensis TaxID=68895 RepID=A0ABT6AU76_9BURK|nr:AAA family ATPase [Cupriavidus basilensis]MDF3836175.1 AAA family ATPase [Cupriavidus basilensis]